MNDISLTYFTLLLYGLKTAIVLVSNHSSLMRVNGDERGYVVGDVTV